MSQYQLNIGFLQADLNTLLAANELVTIVKQTSAGGAPTIAWVTFSPFLTNSVTWEDEYTLYASNTAIEGNATIEMMSQTAAAETQRLIFSSGSFQGAQPGVTLPGDTYGVLNGDTGVPALTFGLAQQANVSGNAVPSSPINAQLVPMQQNAAFTPLDVIQVFMQSNTSNGMVLSNVTGPAITLTFGDGINELAIQYDASVGGFTQAAVEALVAA
ncbi:hypothetical protein [Rhizobacter sp. Root1221]|uniref:hypothetical protein n=1 Tax=Rhizobacter sp. Root1221 TaxID=1736433 RepID=UPI0006F6DCB4|nr:hypothetical protein [Rhizobacter sp. Root1221]KQW02825.1 hypothetical protein ASC87_00245 [Rhizobacter sp. Root1221]